jgi:hypothetical protein
MGGGRRVQAALGLLTFAVLVACLRRLDGRQRLAAIICVPVATLFEVFGSLIWGGYTYRFHNIPLYVPPGHALVYVFGITAARCRSSTAARMSSGAVCSRSPRSGPWPA